MQWVRPTVMAGGECVSRRNNGQVSSVTNLQSKLVVGLNSVCYCFGFPIYPPLTLLSLDPKDEVHLHDVPRAYPDPKPIKKSTLAPPVLLDISPCNAIVVCCHCWHSCDGCCLCCCSSCSCGCCRCCLAIWLSICVFSCRPNAWHWQ